jgi:hypothetical protein
MNLEHINEITAAVAVALFIIWEQRQKRWALFFGALEGKYVLSSANANAQSAASQSSGTSTSSTTSTASSTSSTTSASPITTGSTT